MGGKGSGNRTKSNPFVAKRADMVDPDVNSRTIDFTLALRALPRINLGEEEEVEARTDEFFELCRSHGMRPLVGGFCVAMGMSKPEMWRIVNGETSGAKMGVTPATTEIFKNVLCLIDNNFEQVLFDAKNPVPAIFYSKSNLGWKEAPAETVITHRSEKPALEGSVEEVAARYAEIVGVDDSKRLPEA